VHQTVEYRDRVFAHDSTIALFPFRKQSRDV
jgi:hypothetical protein